MIPVAELYLADGRPFTDVSDTDRDLLAHTMKIRNAIAHRGTHALGAFRRDVPGVSSLPANRQFPGPLLRYVYRARPKENYLDLYLATLEKVIAFLANSW
jgi:hypothetical protein